MENGCLALLFVALIAIASACGDSEASQPGPDAGPVGACGDTGQGSVAGSVGGENLQGLQRVLYLPDLDGEAVLVLSQGRGECNEAPKDLTLVVRLCSAPTVGEIEVVAVDAFDDACGGGQAGQAVLRRDRADLEPAQSGSVQVDEIDTCMNGSLDVTFSGGQYSGNFSAVRCPSTTRS